jgi:hypothetical protein
VTVIDDIRGLDPVAYIRSVGLRPEDSYGFVPVGLEEGSELLYLYRDRPEYEEARPKLAPSIQTSELGPVIVDAPQRVGMQAPDDPALTGGAIGDLIAQAQELQRAWGGAPQEGPAGAPGDPLRTPDPEKLVRLAKLRESGAITNEEYARLVAEETSPTPAPADAEATPASPEGAAPIVAQRLYPGIRMRSSTRQLNRFLPMYCEKVGIGPEDTYGVFPWGTRTSSDGDDMSASTEWDDFWIVYRDRPHYADGREAWAQEMDGKGRWPEPVISPGIEDAPASGPGPGEVKVEKDRWPRKALVMKQSGPELGDSLREKISKWGYEPEDSFGFSPSFNGGSIYFAWREA